MNILCWLGIHRWEFRDTMDVGGTVTEARCRRGCDRYFSWRFVNRDRDMTV